MKITLAEATARIQQLVGIKESGQWDSATASKVLQVLQKQTGLFDGAQLTRIEKDIKKIMASQDQEAADINAIATQVTEIGAGITALEKALAAAGGTTPAVDAALANLKTAVSGTAALLPATP